MNSVDRELVRFCSIECSLQMSGELSVGWMVDAWIYAQQWAGGGCAPTVTDVLSLGKLIEPNDNARGFRTVGVRVGWDVKIDWQLVPEQIVNLLESLPDLTPDQFFWEYEQIHPFVDGNGRSGVVLYNWIKGTLDKPEWAPNFWNDTRRTIGYGA